MPDALVAALALAAAFAVGMIPWALLVTKWVAGVDVRTVGSGNVGATNAARVLGRKWFPLMFALDAAKGAAPVLLFPAIAAHFAAGADTEWLHVACGLAAVLGHVFNPILGFKGGKGVATGAGAIAALALLPALCALGVFGLVLLAFRYVSLASVCGTISLIPWVIVFGGPDRGPLLAFVAIVATTVTIRHVANLRRIAAGTEPKVFEKKAPHAS